MSRLKELQSEFKEYLLQGTAEPMHSNVVDGQPMTAKRKLKVYYEGYRLRLHEALQVDFPKLETLLGGEAFFECCMRYLDKYPSKTFSVRNFGRHFDSFLKEMSPYKDYPFMSEMANFEWALMESLDAQDAPIMTIHDLQQVPAQDWADLTFELHPSVHMREYHWDTPALFKDIDQEKPARQPIELEAPQLWLFWRKDLKSMYESLNPLAYKIFSGIQYKAPFGDIAQSLIDDYDQARIPELTLSHIQYWLEQGLFTISR